MSECPICLEELRGKTFITTACRHSLCANCFILLNDPVCPCCRGDLTKQLPSAFLKIITSNNNKKNKPSPTLPILSSSPDPRTRTMNVNSLTDFPPLR